MEKNTDEKYTFDMVWKALMENREQMKISSEESRKETEELKRIIREQSAEGKDTDRRIKELTKNVYGISASNGLMAEDTILYALERDKTFAGIKFDDIEQRFQIQDKLKTITDIDAVLLNGDTIALIEVKYKVDKKDVKELISDKLKNFKKYYPDYRDYKILLGVGGMGFEKDAIKEAKEKGVGIIKVVGDKVEYYTEGIREY